jgi:MoaA/NifB/PqqE/SkfB family radical SAM enzyme
MISSIVARTSETVLPVSVVSRIRATREWKNWIRTITSEVLEDQTNASPEVKRRIFKAYVRRVEIETHAKCNRVCSFCPNAVMDRRRNDTLTDSEMLDRLFGELGSIDYSNQIVIARYSEPLANLDYLYDRLAAARRLVPRAQLAITTNTDYLTPVVLDRLLDLGLGRIYMSLYLRSNERWSLDVARGYNDKLVKKLGLERIRSHETPVSLQCTYQYKGIDLFSTCHNWDEYGTDRGGTLEQYVNHDRVSPCRDPFETFVVDYSGAVMPCCAVRSDLPQGVDFAAGNLTTPGTSVFDVYAGQLSAWRRSLVTFGPKASPCTTCSHREIPEDLVKPIAARMEKHLHRIGQHQLLQSNSSRRA